MYPLLEGLRIIEASSFIAAPSCGLYLSQFGAEVIRVDTIGGGLDAQRWPLAPNGASLYWEGLNKGKKSVSLDLRSPEGRDLLGALATAPGADAGILLTNFPADGFLSHDKLSQRRRDLIVLRLMGRSDGGSALDYTINSAYGVPWMTGPADLGDAPVNHMLPAWDLLSGAYAAFSLLAALRHRAKSGQGQEVRISLEDIAIAALGNTGVIAESTLNGHDRARIGNDLYGAFGRDFVTADNRRMMIVAITQRQWSGLVKALGIGAAVARLEQETGVSFAKDEGLRFIHRDRLNPIVAEAVAAQGYDALVQAFQANGVCWGPYRTLAEAIGSEEALSEHNPMLSMIAHRSGQSYLTPGAAAAFTGLSREAPGTAPALGEHTDEVLSAVLGLSSGAIASLHERGVVGGERA
jgi:2-methylfumaryl-CoA isomerase